MPEGNFLDRLISFCDAGIKEDEQVDARYADEYEEVKGQAAKIIDRVAAIREESVGEFFDCLVRGCDHNRRLNCYSGSFAIL